MPRLEVYDPVVVAEPVRLRLRNEGGDVVLYATHANGSQVTHGTILTIGSDGKCTLHSHVTESLKLDLDGAGCIKVEHTR